MDRQSHNTPGRAIAADCVADRLAAATAAVSYKLLAHARQLPPDRTGEKSPTTYYNWIT